MLDSSSRPLRLLYKGNLSTLLSVLCTIYNYIHTMLTSSHSLWCAKCPYFTYGTYSQLLNQPSTRKILLAYVQNLLIIRNPTGFLKKITKGDFIVKVNVSGHQPDMLILSPQAFRATWSMWNSLSLSNSLYTSGDSSPMFSTAVLLNWNTTGRVIVIPTIMMIIIISLDTRSWELNSKVSSYSLLFLFACISPVFSKLFSLLYMQVHHTILLALQCIYTCQK